MGAVGGEGAAEGEERRATEASKSGDRKRKERRKRTGGACGGSSWQLQCPTRYQSLGASMCKPCTCTVARAFAIKWWRLTPRPGNARLRNCTLL